MIDTNSVRISQSKYSVRKRMKCKLRIKILVCTMPHVLYVCVKQQGNWPPGYKFNQLQI